MAGCSILLGGFARLALAEFSEPLERDEQGERLFEFIKVGFVPYVYNRSFFSLDRENRPVWLKQTVFSTGRPPFWYINERLGRGAFFNAALFVMFSSEENRNWFSFESFIKQREQRGETLWRFFESFWRKQ